MPTTAGPRASRTAAQTREHVLSVAHDLFYWHGIRATGVDTIATQAGVAPTTLYRLFASKDDLVAAYVERAKLTYQQWFTAAAAAADPRARILGVFDELINQVQPHQCRGCPFLMALAEVPDPAMAAHRHAVELKAWVRDQLAELTTALDARDPAMLADQLALVMEGVYASVQALGADGPARRARALAAQLLDLG
ncbi:MAG: TetR/AcrR family transcriptional regulator [Pseudonocardiaceae bacterium]